MKMISRQSDIDLITRIHNKHKAHGYAENTLGAENIIERDTLRRYYRDSDRHTGGRYRQRQKINRKGHLVKADTFPAEYTGYENPVERADYFYHQTGYGENKRSLQKTFGFMRFF